MKLRVRISEDRESNEKKLTSANGSRYLPSCIPEEAGPGGLDWQETLCFTSSIPAPGQKLFAGLHIVTPDERGSMHVDHG